MKKFLVIFFLYAFAVCNTMVFATVTGESKTKAVNLLDSSTSLFAPLPFSVPALQATTSSEEPPTETSTDQFKNPDYVNKLKTAKLPGLKLAMFPKKRLGRAVLEGVGQFIYSISSYWIRQKTNEEDWEYHYNFRDQIRRFLFKDGVRFDSNSFPFNWTHAGAGAIYYNYARSNHLNPAASFLYTFTASYAWEFLAEFKEMISLNDMIFTPMGGLSIGEPFYQLGRFFRSQRLTFLNRIGRIVSDPILSICDLIDAKKYKGTNQFAFTEDYWHDISINLGPRFDTLRGSDVNSYGTASIESQLILIPEYGTEGTVSRGVKKTMLTQLDVALTVGAKGVYEFAAFTKAVFFGYFKQNIRLANSTGVSSADDAQNNPENRVGYSFFVGAATAFDLLSQDVEKVAVTKSNTWQSQYKFLIDKHSIIHLLGPTFDFTLYQRDFTLRFTADAYADFALSYSHAYQKYSQLHPVAQTKITLKNHGYYYALGFTLSSVLQLDYQNLQLKSKLIYHHFDSVQGLDRYQKDIPLGNDFTLQDQRLHFNTSLGYTIPGTAVQLTLGFEQFDLQGVIENFAQHHNEHRSYFQIRYQL